MSSLRVLFPDSTAARALDWGDAPVDVAYYDPADPDPAEVLVAGVGPLDAVRVFAKQLPRL